MNAWRATPVGIKPIGALGRPSSLEDHSGIAGTAYDTAWLASVPAVASPMLPRFPSALQWLVEHQQADGSWGGIVRYEHDRVLSTLAALAALAPFARREKERERVERGVRYLWQHGHLLPTEPAELVGFELLLPALIQRVHRAGVAAPPHLDVYRRQRAEKLRLVPPEALYSPTATIVHSLEFLGDEADPTRLKAAQGENGALGNSPAATAYYLTRSNDRRAEHYLRECLARHGGVTVPVLYPCETFELLWSAYHYFLVGVSARLLLTPGDARRLQTALSDGGVSLSSSFPIPDADDTAVALVLLHDLDIPVDPAVLRSFARPDGYFASFPHERHSSVGVNVHVLHALLRVPGFPDVRETVRRLIDFLLQAQINDLYWIDKWHISPYYATAHVVRVLAELEPDWLSRVSPAVERARDWLRLTQNDDGSWGFYGQPTAEETAYGLLALSVGAPWRIDPLDGERCARAGRYLATVVGAPSSTAEPTFPPLWIDKCLYTPTLVVRSVIDAARLAASVARHDVGGKKPAITERFRATERRRSMRRRVSQRC